MPHINIELDQKWFTAGIQKECRHSSSSNINVQLVPIDLTIIVFAFHISHTMRNRSNSIPCDSSQNMGQKQNVLSRMAELAFWTIYHFRSTILR